MIHRLIIATALGLFALTSATPTWAMYSPRLGRFLQQDPNGMHVGPAHVPTRRMVSRPSDIGTFIHRDGIEPTSQYLDGMNLYGYVRANPVRGRDPLGLKTIKMEFMAFIPSTLPNGAAKLASAWDPQYGDIEGTWIDEPGGIYWLISTDNRGFGGGSARLKTIATVDLDKVGKLQGGTYTTTKSDASVRMRIVSGKPKIESKTSVPTVTESVKDLFGCSSEITVVASGQYPFVGWYAPNLDYRVTFRLTKNSAGGVFVLMDGWHNEFPNYEGLVDGSNVYKYPTTWSGPGFLSVGFSDDFVSESVTIYP